MLTAFGWVLFGMAVWGLIIVMQALERRFAPELGTLQEDGPQPPPAARTRDLRDQEEIAELRRRIETLEAIVTDRRYQWERELDRS